MNTEAFTGKAQAYANARPGYPAEAVEYIHKLASPGAVFADVGAGTGKFTELLARYGNAIFAVEPNEDMRRELVRALSPFGNAKAVQGTAEKTSLPDGSVDVVTNAQALRRFDVEAFRAECQRIGRARPLIVTLYNSVTADSEREYDVALGRLYRNPVVRRFSNPIGFSRERWLEYSSSISGAPRESDPGYREYFDEIIRRFDRESIDGIVHRELVTTVFSEIL